MPTFAQRQRNRERQVEQVVKRHPECLDSYRNLIIWYWHDIDGALKYNPATATFSLTTWNIYRLSSPEAITRAFRKLRENKVTAINEEAEKWRDREEKRYHEAYSKKNRG